MRVIRAAAIAAGLTVGLTFIVWWAGHGLGQPYDVHNYYSVNLANPYPHHDLGTESYLYAPPFALLGSALRILPFEVVTTVWRLLELAALLLLAGPFAVVALFTPPVASELNLANINLLLALVAVAGLRWPALWSIVLITKPSCGVGLLWFVVRREWRSLHVALAVTSILCVASAIVLPRAWPAYLELLLTPAPAWPGNPVLWIRLPIAAATISIAAMRGWRPLLVVGVWLGLPAWEPVSSCVLTAALAYAWRSPLSRPVEPAAAAPSDTRAIALVGRPRVRLLGEPLRGGVPVLRREPLNE